MNLSGNAHQRIYARKVILGRCGINIRGRARKLRINYRTTRQIKNWADAILTGVPYDDLDGGRDDRTGKIPAGTIRFRRHFTFLFLYYTHIPLFEASRRPRAPLNYSILS